MRAKIASYVMFKRPWALTQDTTVYVPLLFVWASNLVLTYVCQIIPTCLCPNYSDPPPSKKPRFSEGKDDGSSDNIRISERNTNSPYKR